MVSEKKAAEYWKGFIKLNKFTFNKTASNTLLSFSVLPGKHKIPTHYTHLNLAPGFCF